MNEKIKFSDFGLIYEQEYEYITFDDKTIQIKTYLPIDDTLNMVADTINFAADINKFYNVGKIDVAFAVYTIKYYTNIELTDEDLENITTVYDTLITSGLYAAIKEKIEGELEYVKNLVLETVKSIYEYDHSLLGIITTISQDYETLNLDADEIKNKLADPNNLNLIKEVVTKLG